MPPDESMLVAGQDRSISTSVVPLSHQKLALDPQTSQMGPDAEGHLMLHCITALLEKGRWVSGWSQLDGEMVFWRFQILSISDADL